MGYERTPHVHGTQRLRDSDTSSFRQVSLTVTRTASGHGTWSVVVRTAGGGWLTDQRLLTGALDLAPGTPASVHFLQALKEALEQAAGPPPGA